jgi:bifunctional UDP-N-acetylglucosamine pyrophosphorylase/glucosamine-1-phosphate N-acetyltransferase
MAIDGRHALALLDAVRPDNLQNEFYLTDVVAIARRQGLAAAYLVAAEDEVLGVNDRAQLAVAEAAMQARLRAAHLSAGVTMIAPETVHLRHDTRIGADVVIEPFVVFGAGVSVEEGATIHAFSHLDGARVGRGAHVGPYARLRPGTVIGEGARIGNFVETKAAEIGAGAKVNHLSYVGDATVGPGANVGAGVITCNYDGFGKFRTEIGEGAFIGSNTALVAPVSVGAGAIVGAGSVITRPVEADALGLARARQEVKPGWARAFRAMRAAAKAKRP